jgi:hypothetical protein
MIRGAQAAEGGLQGAGACSGPRGSPGQHARLWASRCLLLKRRSSISSILGRRSILFEFPHPTRKLDDPRCAGSGGSTPGSRRLLGASGQPGAACAPLGKQMPALEAPVQHRRAEVDFSNFHHPPENTMIRGAQAAKGGLQGAGACSGPRGSPGQHARLWASRCL